MILVGSERGCSGVEDACYPGLPRSPFRFSVLVLRVLLRITWWVSLTLTAGGSISPPDAPLKRIGDNTYVLLSDIRVPEGEVGIVIGRSGVVLDEPGHRIVGGKVAIAIASGEEGVRDIVLKNLVIEGSSTSVSIKHALSVSIVNCSVASAAPINAYIVHKLETRGKRLQSLLEGFLDWS